MATNTNSGFTIIETLLFLAVSAALVTSVMIGFGATITQQRYHDSVDSLKSYIQEQYGLVANTVNSRSGTESCRLASTSIVLNNDDPSNPQPVGMSECLMLGRYMSSNASGTVITVSDVIAHPVANPSSVTSDILDLRNNYILTRATNDRVSYSLAWGARIVQPTSITNPQPFSAMIVRSPRSGSLLTFTADTVMSPAGIVTTARNSNTLNLCVDGDRGIAGGSLRAVRISGYATSQGAVQVPLESEPVCG